MCLQCVWVHTLLRVGESEDVVISKDDPGPSPQLLGLSYETSVYEGLTVWVWDYTHSTCSPARMKVKPTTHTHTHTHTYTERE